MHDVGIYPVDKDVDRAILNQEGSRRHAVLIPNRLTTWRTDLTVHGSKLQSLGDRSWHVEVFDLQVGYLGLFRQSRVTGKWFMGKDSVHMRGNPSLQS